MSDFSEPLSDEELQQRIDEQNRKKIIPIIVCVVGGVFLAVGWLASAMIMFVLGGLTIFIGVMLLGKISKAIKALISANITVGVLKEKFNMTVYRPEEHIGKDVIERTGLITSSYNEVSGSDYFEGSYKGVNMACSDLHLVQVSRHVDSKGHVHETRTTVFEGQWIVMKLRKKLNSRTIIREKNEKLFGGYCKQKGDIETEDVKFNEQFQVKTDNDHDAFYILTPHFMNFIKSADNAASAKTSLCFMNDEVHFLCYNNKNLFEVSGSNVAENRRNMQEEANYIAGVMDEIIKNDFLFGNEQ